MRSLRLLEVAAQSESLRLRRKAEGMGRKAVLFAAAAVFGVVALGLLHAAAWMALAEYQGRLLATLILALSDGVLMGVLLWLGRSRADPVAAEALRLRRYAMTEMGLLSPTDEAGRLLTWRLAARELGGLVADLAVRAIARR